MNNKYYMKAQDVRDVLGVSRSKAYDILRKLNAELEKEGYAVVPGKIPRPYWNTKFYGYSHMQYD